MLWWLILGCAPKQQTESFVLFPPPVAVEDPHPYEVFGVQLMDPYHWLRDLEDDRRVSHLNKENQHTRHALHALQPSMAILQREMERQETHLRDVSHRIQPSEEAERFCTSLQASNETVVTSGKPLPVFNSDRSRCAVPVQSPVDPERYTIEVRSSARGGRTLLRVRDTDGGVVWLDQNRFYYTVLDTTGRPDHINLMDVGTGRSVLIFQELEEDGSCRIWGSKSGRFAFIDSRAGDSNEVFFLDKNREGEMFELLTPRKDGVFYRPVHQGKGILVLVEEETRTQFMMVDPLNPELHQWEYLYETNKGVLYVEEFRDRAIVVEQERQTSVLTSIDQGGGIHSVEIWNTPHQISRLRNSFYRAERFAFALSSFLFPEDIVYFDFATLGLQFGQEINASEVYQIHKESNPSSQEGDVVSLLRVDKKIDGSRYPKPTIVVLNVGENGQSENLFNPSIQSVLDRGVMYVACDVRPLWQSIARMDGYIGEQLPGTSELTGCIQHLFKMGYTTQEQLAVVARGPEAMIVLELLRRHPDWMKTISLRNPVLSVAFVESNVSTIESQSLSRLLSTTPYENVIDPPFPNVLIWEERSEDGWQSAGWLAKIRDRSPSDDGLLLWNQFLSADETMEHQLVEMAYLLDKFRIPVEPSAGEPPTGEEEAD